MTRSFEPKNYTTEVIPAPLDFNFMSVRLDNEELAFQVLRKTAAADVLLVHLQPNLPMWSPQLKDHLS